MDKKRFFTLTIIAIIVLALTVLAISSKFSPVQAETSNSTLSITGLVENPMNLTLNDIKAMPHATENAVLVCVGAPSTPLVQGNWTGVELSYLLQQAKVSPSAIKVAFFALDGFTTDLTVPRATQDNSILVAYQLNSTPLGGLRLVVPFSWGYKWINDLTEIKLVNYNFLGTEESLGYSDDATVTGGSTAPTVNVPNFSFSSPNPAPSTQNSPPTPTALPQSPSPTINPTTPSAVSNSKPQSTSAFLAYIAEVSAIIVVSAVVSAATLIRLRKAKNLKQEEIGLAPQSP